MRCDGLAPRVKRDGALDAKGLRLVPVGDDIAILNLCSNFGPLCFVVFLPALYESYHRSKDRAKSEEQYQGTDADPQQSGNRKFSWRLGSILDRYSCLVSHFSLQLTDLWRLCCRPV